MTQQHPITPPPKLVLQWADEFYSAPIAQGDALLDLATRAAQYGADQELEACLNWLTDRERFPVGHEAIEDLKADRRPKPPSLKEQALLAIDTAVADYRIAADVADVVRRALEQLSDNE
jgi:hypothetical protein